MLQYIVILGAVVNLLGSAAYIRDTLIGKTQPNRITFLMWGIAPCIGAAAAFSDGVRWSVLPVLTSGILPFLILLASFFNKKAVWELHWYDYVCGAFSLLALVLWKETQQPTIAIVFAIIGDGFAGLPTFKKSWTHPETETPLAYIATAFAAATSFFAMRTWRFEEYAFPAYLVLSGTILFLIISYRKDCRSLIMKK